MSENYGGDCCDYVRLVLSQLDLLHQGDLCWLSQLQIDLFAVVKAQQTFTDQIIYAN